jgi:hypothetical protein
VRLDQQQDDRFALVPRLRTYPPCSDFLDGPAGAPNQQWTDCIRNLIVLDAHLKTAYRLRRYQYLNLYGFNQSINIA